MIVTGANCGIGLETAVQLAKAGAVVVLACRDVARGQDAERQVRALSGSQTARFIQLDLASFASIRQFAVDYKAFNAGPLHVLINNAGLSACPFQKTADGIEMQLGVNHFGHFLLTSLLLDQLRAGAPSRVVVVASESHRRVPAGGIKWDGYNDEESYGRLEAYGQSKLANVYFARELHRRYNGQGITAVSLHPGSLIATDIARNAPYGLGNAVWLYGKMFAKSIPQGAATTVYCAVAPNVPGARYYRDCQLAEETPLARNDANAQRLWELSNRVCNTSV